MHWDFEWTIFEGSIGPFGPIELRWYGVLFALGLLLCAYHAPKYFDLWGMPKAHAERLTLWVPVAMLLGAHYIHLIFYETEGLFDFPRFEEGPDGSSHFVLGRFFGLGSGLASHGGGLGCLLGLAAFWWFHGRRARSADGHAPGLWRYTDPVMVASVWVYPWVRLGNFANSEIWGRVTDGPFGVIFDRRWEIGGPDGPARHPVQLYEAALYFAELAFAIWLQKNYVRKWRPGVMFLVLILTHFSLRFFAEFFKESQGVDEGWSLNMGHYLSLPVVLLCAFLLFFTKRFNLNAPLNEEELKENARVFRAPEELALAAAAEPAAEPSSEDAGSPAPSSTGPATKKKKKKKA